MMITRDKKVGKSTYRIICEPDGRYHIMELYMGQSAVTPTGYYTVDDALQALDAFDSENMIIRS